MEILNIVRCIGPTMVRLPPLTQRSAWCAVKQSVTGRLKCTEINIVSPSSKVTYQSIALSPLCSLLNRSQSFIRRSSHTSSIAALGDSIRFLLLSNIELIATRACTAAYHKLVQNTPRETQPPITGVSGKKRKSRFKFDVNRKYMKKENGNLCFSYNDGWTGGKDVTYGSQTDMIFRYANFRWL